MAKRLNRKYVTKLVSNSPAYKSEIFKVMEDRAKKAKALMLNEFDRHPVTQEIAGGINSSNVSKTLPSSYGNLYTFIGFRYGSDPISPIKNLLALTRVLKKTRTRVVGNKITTYLC